MSVAPGWYYYEGDPTGTVRRWNGNEWIGFPMEPPPEHLGHAAPIFDTHTERAKPLPNQRRLFAFGVGGFVGVVLMIAALIPVALDLLDARSTLPSPADHPLVDDPFGQRSVQHIGIAFAVGGILFLLWLWRANENLGRSHQRSRNRSGNRSPGFYAFLALILTPVGAIAFNIVTGFNPWAFAIIWAYWWSVYRICRPVPRIMFNLIERSAGGSDQGQIAPFVGGLWWPLWLGSVWILSASLAFTDTPSTPDITSSQMLFPLIAVAAHMVALLLALRLIWVITKFQDRRLAT